MAEFLLFCVCFGLLVQLGEALIKAWDKAYGRYLLIKIYLKALYYRIFA